MLNLHLVEFVRSAVKTADFPNDNLPQIAFAGKSNVGKSSTINRLLNRKNFARVGNAPGKTIHINFFEIDKKAYFVDLPGYGYAKVSKKERDRWGKLMDEYFARLWISVTSRRRTMSRWPIGSCRQACRLQSLPTSWTKSKRASWKAVCRPFAQRCTFRKMCRLFRFPQKRATARMKFLR